MDKKRKPKSQCSSPLPSWLADDTPRRGLSQWEEDLTLQELYEWEEEVRVREPSQRRGRRRRELYKFEEDVRVRELSQWSCGRHPELYQREESVTVQELHEWEEGGVRYHEVTQWEERVTVQELPQREGVSYKRLSQGGADVGYSSWDKPVSAGDTLAVPQERPSSPSSVGTAVAAEAAQDLPSPAPAPLSPTEAEPAAPVPDGAAEEEEPQEPVAPEETKAEGSPSFGELVPSARTESLVPAPQSPSEGSQALLGTGQKITPEIVSKAELVMQGSEQQLEEQGAMEESTAAEMQETAAGTQNPVPAPQSPSEGSQVLLDMAELMTTEILSAAELVIQGSDQQLEEQGDLEQSMGAEVQERAAETQNPVPAPQSPSEGSQVLLDMAELMTTKILSEAELVIQGSEQKLEEKEDVEQSTAAEMQERASQIESPVPAPQSPSEGSQALLGSDQQITPEILSEAELEIQGSEQQLEEQGAMEQSTAAEMQERTSRIESPVPGPQSPSEGSQVLLDMAELIATEILKKAELEIQGFDQQLEEQGDMEQTGATGMLTTGTADRPESLDSLPHSPCCLSSPVFTYVEPKALSGQQAGGEGGAVLAVQETEEGAFAEDENNWKFYDELELCKWQDEKEVDSYQWEDGIGQELSQEEDCIGQELSEREVKRHSEQSQRGDDSDRELSLEDCECVTARSTQEEDEWEELGVLELSQGQGTEHRLGILAEEGLPVPVPREAWAECQAPAPCSVGPVCASTPQPEAQAPRGAAAPPTLDRQVAEAGTQTQGPSSFWRVLGALLRLFHACRPGQPQD
ncbi:zinc metalloprotease ZmpB-like [Pseudopipra pipra]|uniref:zinc metalloprotease ZmpB-like n=1 Tax=Pseudopipra pipra TaxID=415032 RepID=UPI003138F548